MRNVLASFVRRLSSFGSVHPPDDSNSIDVDDPPYRGAPSSVLGARLAVDADGKLPTIESLGLVSAKQLAFELQKQRSYARLNDMHGMLSGKPGGRWVIETHGILGVIGEQVLVAIEAEVEKEIIRRALAVERRSESVIAHHSRALRFFAEAQANALVVALHGAANLVVRSLEFDIPLNAAELAQLRIKPAVFIPGSSGASAWLSMNAGTIDILKTIAASRSSASKALADALALTIDDPNISGLIGLRNVHYHRWRGETAGVTGISHGAETATQTLAAGQPVSFGRDLLPEYSEGVDVLLQVDAAGLAALHALAAHMEALHEAWIAAFGSAFGNGE